MVYPAQDPLPNVPNVFLNLMMDGLLDRGKARDMDEHRCVLVSLATHMPNSAREKKRIDR